MVLVSPWCSGGHAPVETGLLSGTMQVTPPSFPMMTGRP